MIPSDYATSQTIYIATGDRDAFDNNSVGVLKSTDGARTNGRIFRSVNNEAVWTQVYISSNAARIELAVSAADPSIVYCVVASASNAGSILLPNPQIVGPLFLKFFMAQF